MANTPKHIVWVDAAKGIAIALVVAAHSVGGQWADAFAPFMMPLFFMAAGFCLNLGKWKGRWQEFLRGRVKRILVPFFLLEICFWPVWSVRGLFLPPVGTALPPMEALGGILAGNSAGLPIIALWFLPCFFLAEVIFLCVFSAERDNVSRRDMSAALGLSLLGYAIGGFIHLPWGLDIALYAQVYILTGRWLRTAGIEKFSFWRCMVLLLIVLVSQVYFGVSFDMASRWYGSNPVLAYAAGISGGILLMRGAAFFVKSDKSFIAEMGRRSMAIYLLHPFVQIIITDVLLSTLIEGDYLTVFYIWQAGIPITILGIAVPVYISRHWAQKPFIRYFGL